MSQPDETPVAAIVDRAVAVLEGEPKVVGFVRTGNHIVLTLSFRGCDDDAARVQRQCPNPEPHEPHEWDFIRDCPGVSAATPQESLESRVPVPAPDSGTKKPRT